MRVSAGHCLAGSSFLLAAVLLALSSLSPSLLEREVGGLPRALLLEEANQSSTHDTARVNKETEERGMPP